MPKVYFAHGKESGPWGAKIVALAEIARSKGFEVVSPDYSDLADPDQRVKRLLAQYSDSGGPVVLVGSSMGGYVSAVASPVIKPAALFLMAPAFYIPRYAVQEPAPGTAKTVIVHGWEDDVVPVENSIRFARKFNCDLHVVNDGHRLMDSIAVLERLFAALLDEVLASA